MCKKKGKIRKYVHVHLSKKKHRKDKPETNETDYLQDTGRMRWKGQTGAMWENDTSLNVPLYSPHFWKHVSHTQQ